MPKQGPSGEVPDVNASDSQGILIGSGNQYNTWAQKQPLDPAVQSGRNPHVAVSTLRQASHNDLVEFFIRAAPDDVSEILEVFLEVDLPRLVATLGDISRRKATELIGAIDEDERPAVLDDLLEATEEIARKAAKLGWADAEPLEIFMEGYARKYDNGHVFWSVGDGIVRTRGAIDRYWAEGSTDLGFPVQDPETAPSSPYGTTGVRQRFQPSTVYSSKHGVFLITDAMRYENEGGSGGWLGFPVSGRERNGQFGDRQMFEGGAIYSYVVEGPEGLRSFAVRRVVADALPGSNRFRPTSKEAKTASSYGWLGTVQHFEVKLESGTYQTAVYTEPRHGPVIVAREVWAYYRDLGAERSWLGSPIDRRMTVAGVSVVMPQFGESVTEGTVTRSLKKEGEHVTADEPLLEVSTDKVDTEIPSPAIGILRGIAVNEDETVAVGAQLATIEDSAVHVGNLQRFEKGWFCWREGTEPIPVSKAVAELIEHSGSVWRCGSPVSEEQSFGPGESDRIQFFENGVVTCRNGKYDVWVHPDPKPEPPTETNRLPRTIPRAVPRAIPRAVPSSTGKNP